MGCLSSGIFWGVLVVIIGLVIIINVIFGTKIPIIPIIFGLIFIYIGIRIITGNSWCRRTRTAIFEETKYEKATGGGKYDVIFGRNVVDLSDIQLKEGMTRVEVNTIFGSSVVKINPAMPVKIRASAAFGSAHMPDHGMAGFGEHTYKTDTLKQADTPNYLLVILNVVFGSSEVVTK
jgi:hypothetical protein